MLISLQFDRPGWLILSLLVIPIVVFAWNGLSNKGSRGRAIASTIIRCVVVLLFTVSIARPVWEKVGEGVTLVTILDRSQSIPQPIQDNAVQVLQEWSSIEKRGDKDMLSVISVGKDAVISSMPTHTTILDTASNDPRGNATNLAKGIQLALALMPAETSSRILLVSDGNETDGEVLAAADLASANGVPIDVIPLQFSHEREVLVEKVLAPTQTRQGQTIPVRVVLRSIGKNKGVLHLLHNGNELQLSEQDLQSGMQVTLNTGANAFVFDIPIHSTGPQKFEAMWEPVKGNDTIAVNNTGLGISFVSQSGKVLLVSSNPEESNHLVDLLISAGLEIKTVQPEGLPRDSIGFSSFDAIILNDIARWMIDDLQERHLHAFVHDLGGGLIIIGGPVSFGAGGWIGSTLEKAMPLNCEPPQTRELPRGALALIMHSCEMPEGNYWGQKMAMAAVDSLSELDYVGIIEYNWDGGPATLNNSGWTLPLSLAGDRVAAHDAINSLVFGDMQDFGSPMKLAVDGLSTLDASQKHVIIISDGDPGGPSQELLEQYRASQITVSTIMVGGHGSARDMQKMKGIATATGGRFYMVNDPTQLPNIFIKEARMNSRSLIQEGQEYEVAMHPTGTGPVQLIEAVPTIQGYVVTGAKGGLAQTPWVIPVSDADDPLLAWWNYGLGKSIAFTSDLGQRWATTWPPWSEFQNFWEGCVRWSMRSATPPNMLVNAKTEGEKGIIDIELLDNQSAFLNFMRSKAVVINPSGEAQPVDLLQTGPGRYHTEFDAVDSGAWLVNVVFQDADGETSGRIPIAVTVPYAREYVATTHNTALLAEIARRTNGRVLSFQDQLTEELFDKRDLYIPVSPTSVWDLIAMIAAGLLLLDVAVRRLWIDKRSMQSMFAPVGQVSRSSVEALKRVHQSQPKNKHDQIEPEKVEHSPKPKPEIKESRSEETSDNSLDRLVKKKRDRENE